MDVTLNIPTVVRTEDDLARIEQEVTRAREALRNQALPSPGTRFTFWGTDYLVVDSSYGVGVKIEVEQGNVSTVDVLTGRLVAFTWPDRNFKVTRRP